MKIAVVGTDGHMGGLLASIIDEREGMENVDIKDDFDVIIDFSHPNNLSMIVDRAAAAGKPAVIATTGFTAEQEDEIKKLAAKVPVVYSANFSLGISVMKKIVSEITPVLKEAFDIEVVEQHHRRKLDAPSGTAKMLVRAIDPDGEFKEVDGRSGMGKRGREIGVHAIRGGTVPGNHSVIYAGEDEVITIEHSAGSRKIFAVGSLKAAEFAAAAAPGLYDMDAVLFGKEEK